MILIAFALSGSQRIHKTQRRILEALCRFSFVSFSVCFH